MAYHRSPALLQMIPRRINYRSFHHWKLIRYHRGCDGLYRQGEEQKAAVTPQAQNHLDEDSSNRRRSCHRNVTELSQSPWCVSLNLACNTKRGFYQGSGNIAGPPVFYLKISGKLLRFISRPADRHRNRNETT
jgi:hypothetical protein